MKHLLLRLKYFNQMADGLDVLIIAGISAVYLYALLLTYQYIHLEWVRVPVKANSAIVQPTPQPKLPVIIESI